MAQHTHVLTHDTTANHSPLPEYLSDLMAPFQALADLLESDADILFSAGAFLEGYASGNEKPSPEATFLESCSTIMQDHANPDLALVIRDLCDRIAFKLLLAGQNIETYHGAIFMDALGYPCRRGGVRES